MYKDYKNKILEFYDEHRRMPAYREIMSILGFKSTNAVYRLVRKLIEDGVVEKDVAGKLVMRKGLQDIPMLGSVTAGFPAFVEEELTDTINLDDYLVKKKSVTYTLEVDGDSMIDAHIADGDIVIAEKADKAKDMDIVIAEVDGEWTMKYFREKGNKKWLEPANKNYNPIYPKYSLRIAAIVKGVVRKFN